MSNLIASAFELTLMRSAAFYNLDEKSERQRSNAALVRLFDLLIRITEPKALFEIGACKAEFSRLMKKKLPNMFCVAYEANPHTYGKYVSLIQNDLRQQRCWPSGRHQHVQNPEKNWP